MKLAHFFIDRPVFASVLSIVTVIVGGLAYFALPVAQYPEIAPPTVVVKAAYPGADARTVAKEVSTPIEEQINGVENMLYMSSDCTNDGNMNLVVTFKLGTNLDVAQVQVQNRVALANPQLPQDVRQLGVTVKKSSPDITLAVLLYSPDKRYDTVYLSNYALLQVQDQIARLPGVGDVYLFGARDYAMRLWLDPEKLAARSLTAGDVVSAIQEQNVQVAAGVVGAEPLPPHTAEFQLTVNAQGRLTDPAQFSNIVLKTGSDGSLTRVGDVGRVELGAADYSVNAYINGFPSVAIPVFQLPGTNSIATADAVYAKMKELRKSFPPGLEYAIPYDTTLFTRASIQDVKKTLLIAVLLVVIVVLVFLQSWRASLIPMMSVPVSLIGTLAVMEVMGFSINNLSLFGMVLAIGIVVDDAIVVVENVERWIEKGYSPREAAYKAMDEVTGAIIAIAFGLTAVFVPVAFISGISGQFYKQFALTISFSTLLSAFNSLTLSPAMAALLLRGRDQKPDIVARIINVLFGWFFRLFNRGLEAVTHGYGRAVRRVIRVSILVLIVYLGLFFLTYRLFRTVPTGFIPSQDSGYLLVNLQMPDAASFDRTDRVMHHLMDIVQSQTDCVAGTFGITGFSFVVGSTQSNTGTMFIALTDFKDRVGHPNLTLAAIQQRFFGLFSQIEEGRVLIFPPPPVRGIGTAGGFKMEVEDRSGNATPQDLQRVTDDIVAHARQDPRLLGPAIFTSFRANVPQLYVNVDRDKVKAQHVNVADVFQTLQVYLGSLYINDFNFLGRTYRVTAQADSRFRSRAEDILNLKTRNAAGQMVPLKALVDVHSIADADRISHYNLYPAAEINGSAAPGYSSGTALDVMEDLAHKYLPRGYDFEWTDLSYQERAAGDTALFVFPLCIFFVWMTHSAEYESFSLSSAIILTVPMCLLFGITGVWLRGMDNNIFTQIGFVVLAGLSAKNAVLIVEFAKQQQEHNGLGAAEAAAEAARLRLRPILMTSFAFILGVVPLVWATGAGFEMRRALGTAVFFGMLGVTLFGLFLTPVLFTVIRKLARRDVLKPDQIPRADRRLPALDEAPVDGDGKHTL